MTLWNRRHMLAGIAAGAAPSRVPSADALGLAADKIKVIRYYTSTGDAQGRQSQPMVNQSANVVIIETESGRIGIDEGGEPRGMEECAAMLIGQDSLRIENMWQRMLRGYFYPAGREKIHSLGALDLALWDLKGKAAGWPVWQLLGGKSRDHVELYATAFPRPNPNASIGDTARACREQGFRAYRSAADIGGTREVDRFALVRHMFEDCDAMQKATGDGGWAMDFHTELDPPDAMRLCQMIETAGLSPYFCEDLIRSENVDA